MARPDIDALLVPPGDAAALGAGPERGAGLRRLLARRLTEAGEARAAEFSMDHLAELYLERYERAIELRAAASRRR